MKLQDSIVSRIFWHELAVSYLNKVKKKEIFCLLTDRLVEKKNLKYYV